MITSRVLPFYAPPDADTGAADAGAGGAAAVAAAAAADVEKEKPGTSALDLPEEGKDKVITAPADFPEDWRAKMAGEDKDTFKKLERYKTPADVAKALRAAELRISKGISDEPMPDPAKDAEGAKAWRKERGIPDEPSGYELPKTVQDRMTDADKPVLTSYTEAMHKAGIPPNAVAATAQWYVDQQEASFAAQTAADAKQAEEVQDELRAELGKEFRPAVTIAKRYAEELMPGFWDARLPDGRKLGNVPDLIRKLIDAGTQKYGDVAFAGGEQSTKTMGRLEEIEALRDNDFAKYDSDPKIQREYQDLLDAAIKAGKRKARG